MKFDKKDLLLYAVTDRKWTQKMTLYQQVEGALKGGVTFVQMREKNLEWQQFLEEAIQLKNLCKRYQVPFVINDNVEMAVAVDADGVHIGQNDMEIKMARAKLGDHKIIGISAHTIEQAVEAEQSGADYLGVGAMFPTDSKKDVSRVNLITLKKICQEVAIPVVAIGGIHKNNVMQLAGSEICGIAVISAIFDQPDITEATCQLKQKTKEMINSQSHEKMITF